jgi:thiamine pyrophosphokinase
MMAWHKGNICNQDCIRNSILEVGSLAQKLEGLETIQTNVLWLVQYFLIVSQQLDGVIAVCETSGRLDQILTNLHTLYKAKDIVGNIPVYQLAKDSLTWLLSPGSHRINVGDTIVKKGGWCSLVPLGAGVEHVTTTGLKWNLSKCICMYLC